MHLIYEPETRTVLENVRWETFVELADQRRGSVPRMTYDEGVLELMSLRRQHEKICRLIGRMVETFTEVHAIKIQTVASTTFKRKDLKKAFEADESYYSQHAEQIRVKDEVDLFIDPPPDLLIEVEVTSSAIGKLNLFAAMGVTEVWRDNAKRLQIYRLEESYYAPIETSVAVPGLTARMIDSIVERRFSLGETALIREFRSSLAG